MKKTISNELTQTINKLLQTISAFPPEKFNTIPFEGSWTAAQVCTHILKSVSGVLENLYSKTKPTTRQPDEKREAIKKMFLDFTTKMKSPSFVLPGNEAIEKEKMMQAFEELKTKFDEAINSFDLSESCPGFELPGFGGFTRLEWIWFAIYHTQRHTWQLSNIFDILVNKKSVTV